VAEARARARRRLWLMRRGAGWCVVRLSFDCKGARPWSVRISVELDSGVAAPGYLGGSAATVVARGGWIGELALCNHRLYVLDPPVGFRLSPLGVAVGGARGALLR
jgi:hypothetical protein